jgi:hypothetical protein
VSHSFTLTVHTDADRVSARKAVNDLLFTPSPEQWAEILSPLTTSTSDDSYITLEA